MVHFNHVILQTAHFHRIIFLQTSIIFIIAVLFLVRGRFRDTSFATATTIATGDNTRVSLSLDDQHFLSVTAAVQHLLAALLAVVWKNTKQTNLQLTYSPEENKKSKYTKDQQQKIFF